jgi:malonyl-CoA O-methyltransferase
MTGSAGGPPLTARAAYRLWAPHYHAETAVSALEHRAVDRVMPALACRALLDAGCGTGRRLRGARAHLRVGIDLVADMILAGTQDAARGTGVHAAAGDVCALPLRAGFFDVVWCRLVLGHVPHPAPAYAELGRVADVADALLVVTDFHPAAAAAGHTRSFRDAAGHLHAIEHHVHPAELHVELARCSGWRLRAQADLRVGPDVRKYYEDAGALDRYDAQLGMPLVLMLVFGR